MKLKENISMMFHFIFNKFHLKLNILMEFNSNIIHTIELKFF